MNTQHLGDALDHWKGAIIPFIKSASINNHLWIEPMVWDLSDWSVSHWNLYASLLGVSREEVVMHTTSLKQQRKAYFNEIPAEGDLFLDPDIGLKPLNPSGIHRYVTPQELSSLLDADPHRIAYVYQHFRGNSHSAIRTSSEAALRILDTCHFHYVSGTVLLLAISQQRDRISTVRDNLFKQYEPVSEYRISMLQSSSRA